MDYSLHYLLMADHSMLQKRIISNIKDLNLTSGQPKVLDYLKQNDGAMQKDIAKGCHIEPASISVILNGMEKNGFIVRKIKDNNRRIINIFLTEKGKNACKILEERFIMAEKEALNGFSEEEKENFIKYLKMMYENIY